MYRKLFLTLYLTNVRIYLIRILCAILFIEVVLEQRVALLYCYFLLKVYVLKRPKAAITPAPLLGGGNTKAPFQGAISLPLLLEEQVL